MRVPKHFRVRVGGKVFADKPSVLVYGGETLLELRRNKTTGKLSIDMDVFGRRGQCKASIRSSTVVDNDGSVALSDSDYCIRIVDQSTARTVCGISRRAPAQVSDVDISLLLHAPDGFLIHANAIQTNLPARSASTGFGK